MVQYLLEIVIILLLYLLVVTPTLLRLSSSYEQRHRLENLVHPPQMLLQEVDAVLLQKPVIPFILCLEPMPDLLVHCPYRHSSCLVSLRFPHPGLLWRTLISHERELENI